jgi:hypothetical protein
MSRFYSHFIPRADAELARWASNYKIKIGTLGAGLGLTPAGITDEQDAAQVVIDAVNRVTEKKNEQEEAVIFKNLVKTRELQFLADNAVRHKRHPMYTENMGGELGILGTSTEVLRTELKPSLKLTTFRDSIEIAFNKKRQPGVMLYTRTNGADNWEKLDYATQSPFIDTRPLAVAGEAETREFRARCSNGHMETGLDSDAVSTLYGG